MKFISKKVVTLILFNFLFISIFSNTKQLKKIDSVWKYHLGDNMEYAALDYDDSSWQTLDKSFIHIDDSHFVWLRTNVHVDSNVKNGDLWLLMDKFNGAADFYINGIFAGSRGNLPPSTRVRIEEYNSINVPLNLDVHESVEIAIRIYCPTDKLKELTFYFGNTKAAYSESVIHNQFGLRLFLILAFLCIFIMFYSFAVYLGNRNDKAYLFYSLCMFFIVPYFFDIGSEVIFLPYNINRSICRACLPISTCFMAIFLNRFFNLRGYKRLLLATGIFIVIDFTAYFIVCGKQDAMDMMFNVMLLPVVLVIIYGFTTTIKALKKHEPYAINLFIGFTIGSILSLHDVVYMFIGKVPYMWTQALAFFGLDLTIFITLSMRSAHSQKVLESLAEKNESQHQKLVEIFTSAKELAEETSGIADELADSVNAVMQATINSKNKVDIIDTAIKEQHLIHDETQSTVRDLTSSLQTVNSEFDKTSESIQTTASGTKMVIDGIANVSDGISTAENFTRSLNTLTSDGSTDMKHLFDVIDSIQQSSKEILSVVTTLDTFAQKTDLLAMNAAIEAAHTGVAGKGFAVIAHEIKDLAANSSRYASKIGEIISAVIKNIEESAVLTEKVNQAFSQIKQGASQSVEKVTAAAQSLKEQVLAGNSISHESEMMAESALIMRNNINKQTQYSSHVLENMERLSLASQKVDTASSEISAGAQSLTKQVESLRILADRTRQTAKDLMTIMASDSD